ncbi:MAG: hypothetical protein LBJ82_05150, partial [Deltaproteobacteria bacterium]|nr:hypothetical protein [Deltaproteobacteria bacterium]
MSAVQPGDHLLARCRRCNDVTGHIATLVLDGVVSRVECKACGSIHKYRETPDPQAGRAKRSGRTAGTPQESRKEPRAGQAAASGLSG